jgi:hypothetical protein
MIVIEGGGMTEYVITLRGCHDVTAFRVWLSPTEAALVRQLSLISRTESTTNCEPRLYIDTFDDNDMDKVVSIDEQNPVSTPFGDRSGLRLAGGVATGPAWRPRRVGGGGSVRALPVGDALSGVAGEDRPR